MDPASLPKHRGRPGSLANCLGVKLDPDEQGQHSFNTMSTPEMAHQRKQVTVAGEEAASFGDSPAISLVQQDNPRTKPSTTTTQSSTGSTSSCSDRDSSPDIVSLRNTNSRSTGLSANSNSVRNNSPDTTAMTSEKAAAMSLPPDTNGGGSRAAAAAANGGERKFTSSPAHGGSGVGFLKRSVREEERQSELSSSDEFNISSESERDDKRRKRRGKKRMRPEASAAYGAAAATAGAGDDSTDSDAPAYSTSSSSSRLLFHSVAATSSLSDPTHATVGLGETARGGAPAARSSAPGSWQTRPRLRIVSQTPAVAAADSPLYSPSSAAAFSPPAAPSPVPSLEVLDLSTPSPMATEVIDIDVEDSPPPVMPLPSSPAHDSGSKRFGGDVSPGRRVSSGCSSPGTVVVQGQAQIAASPASSSRGAAAGAAPSASAAGRLAVNLDSSPPSPSAPRASTRGLSATLRPLGITGRPSYSSSPGAARRAERGEGDREGKNEGRTIGAVRHSRQRQRQRQQQAAGRGGFMSGRSVALKEPRRLGTLGDGDRMAAALQESESRRQEQSDMQMALRLQSEENAEGRAVGWWQVPETVRTAARADAFESGGRGYPGITNSNLDLDDPFWDDVQDEHAVDPLIDVGLDGEEDNETSSDGGVFMVSGTTSTSLAGRSSGEGPSSSNSYRSIGGTSAVAAGGRGAAARSSSSRGGGGSRRREDAAADVVDLGVAASDDDPTPLVVQGNGSESDRAAGSRASSRARGRGGRGVASVTGRRAALSRGSSNPTTAQTTSSTTSSSCSRRPRGARAGPGAGGAGRGAYGHLGPGGRAVAAPAPAATERRSADVSASRAAVAAVPLSALGSSTRRSNERNASMSARAAEARRHTQRFADELFLGVEQMGMMFLGGWGFGGGGAASRQVGGGESGRGAARRGVAGSAAHLELMSRNLTPADYQQLLALDDHNHSSSGARVKPKGLSTSEISMLPTQTGNGSGDTEQCCICMDDMKPKQSITRLPACLHTFHSNCIKKWLREQASCPIDKVTVSVTD